MAINILSLAPVYMNTGPMKNFLQPGPTVGLILIPKGKTFTSAETDSFASTLTALINNNTDSLRAFPIQNLVGVEDKSTNATVNTTGYGNMQYVKPGQFAFNYEWDLGGLNFQNVLQNYNNAQDSFDVLLLDSTNNVVIGTKYGTYGFKGLTLSQLWCELPKWNDGSNPTRYYLGLALADSSQLTSRLAYIKLDTATYPVTDFVGLKNLEFSTYQTITSGVAKMKLTTDFGATDLYSLYAAALTTLTASWSFADLAGNSITCSVSNEAATRTQVLTFSGTNYTNLASGGTIVCNTPTISAMAATIPGFANASFNLVKP